MLKQIVVALDGSDYSFSAVDNALFLAEKVHASIKFVYVIDIRKITLPPMYTLPSYSLSADASYLPFDEEIQKMYTSLEKNYREFGTQSLKKAESKAAEKGIVSSAIIAKGIPSEIICEEAKSGDLLVIGKHGENAEYRGVLTGSVTENTIRKTPRPVLVCPAKISDYKKAFFTYNKGKSSENALEFIADNQITGEIEFFCSDRIFSETDDYPKEKEFLEHHGMQVSFTTATNVNAVTVLEQVEKDGADFIVMGAGTNKPLREYILGSLSATVLRKSSVPVLIAY